MSIIDTISIVYQRSRYECFAAWIPDVNIMCHGHEIQNNVHHRKGHKQCISLILGIGICISWITPINIVYQLYHIYGYQTLILYSMDTKYKHCASWIPDIIPYILIEARHKYCTKNELHAHSPFLRGQQHMQIYWRVYN